MDIGTLDAMGQMSVTASVLYLLVRQVLELAVPALRSDREEGHRDHRSSARAGAILATGLSRKEKLTEAKCRNCGTKWLF
jgi:hypothetical protein